MRLITMSIFCLITALFTQVHAADLKVGVVNIAHVMEKAPQADTARLTLEKEFKPREQAMLDLQKLIHEQEDKLTRNGAIMNASDRTRMERDILSSKRELQRRQDEFREDFAFKRNELLDKLQRELIAVIQEYAKTNKFDLLLAEGVVYVSEKLDVTQDIITALKK